MKCYNCGEAFEDASQTDNEICVCDSCERELSFEDDCEDMECDNCGSPGACYCD